MGKLLTVCLLLFSLSGLRGQTTLNAGDIAMTGFNFDAPDKFSFVLLTNITSGTEINFTDCGWQSSGSFRSGEGVLTWTSTTAMTCGTEVTITPNTTASHGTVSLSSGSFALSSSGDQIIAYQGTFGSPTNIAAVHSHGTTWSANATSANTSAVPTGLTDGTNCLAINEVDNGRYDCSTLSPTAALLSAINDNTNWITSNATMDANIGPGCAYSCAASANTITTTGVTGIPFAVDCTTPDNGTVTFTSTGTFTAGNVYTAQLSDAVGNFTSPVNIGTLSSTANSGTINITIPAATTAGTAYRIRVISSTPSVTGTDNGSNLTISSTITTGTLIMNEMSNGASGTKEYFEMMVIGGSCSQVSIQNLIFDDNNGDWGTAGIAAGHLRFTTDPQWGCIPTGSLIVVYNDGDPNANLPADDETDANADNVYVLPVTSTLLETCGTAPVSGSTTGYATGSCAYAAAASWNSLGMSNTADVAQTRDASGNFVHGIGYGTGITAPAGGVAIAGAGGGDVFSFVNTVDDDYTDVANFSVNAVAGNETPGAQNSPDNGAYINTFNCVLPVEFLYFDVTQESESVFLFWSTASEQNCSHYDIQRSSDGINFETIYTMNGAGTSNTQQNYIWEDKSPLKGLSFYRLKQVDFDSEFDLTGLRSVKYYDDHFEIIQESQYNDLLQYHLVNSTDMVNYQLYSKEGKLINNGRTDNKQILINTSQMSSGLYIIVLDNGVSSIRKKVFIQ